jgi:hypothetical protein
VRRGDRSYERAEEAMNAPITIHEGVLKIDDGRFAGILRYYKNTALQTVRDVALPALYECERLGHWTKGTSRRMRAMLSKTHGYLTGEAKSGAILCHGDPISIEYGQFERAPKMLAQAELNVDRASAHPHVLAYLAWCELFAPVAALVHKLDADWSAAGNEQCQACGHAIKSGRFVPLVLDGKNGLCSLWVGRDCAERFFGCKVTGESNGQLKIDAPSTAATTKGNAQ